MNWRARLADHRTEKGPGDSLPKPTKGAFGTFGSDPDGGFPEIATADADAIRARLLSIAAALGIDAAHVRSRSDALLAEYDDCTDCELGDCLRAWDYAARMDAGKAPPGYSKPATCSGCGPVLLWPACPDRVIACPWCFRRNAGKAIPRPSIANEVQP